MLQRKFFSNILNRILPSMLAGALLVSLSSSASLAMELRDDEQGRSSIIQKLPAEAIVHIFSFFSPKELGRLALVSKEWRAISEENTLWKRFETESKKEFALFMNSCAITILNQLSDTTHEIGIACGSGPYATEVDSKMKGASFNECIMKVALPTNQATEIRYRDFPEEITIRGPKKIYGITKIPANSLDIHSSAIHVAHSKCKIAPSDHYMVIWEILENNSRYFALMRGASDDMTFFREFTKQ